MTKVVVAVLTPLIIAVVAMRVQGESLSWNFYDNTCPVYDLTVSRIVNEFLQQDATVAPGLLRLLFHDCFVNGCDGSVLLNSTNGTPPEKSALPNRSLRGFNVIDAIKSEMETQCPGVVSCADILATAARDAIFSTSKISWRVKLGRRDGSVSLASQVNLPSASESISSLISKFKVKGLNEKELVLLQGGAHSIGVGRCVIFRGRLSNFNNTGSPDPTMNPTYAQTLVAQCNGSGSIAVNNDPVTPTLLDTQYFKNVQNNMGLFTSDQEMLLDPKTNKAIAQYATASPDKFADDFGKAMTKMSEIEVLTGSNGSIRTHCAIAN